MHSNNQSWQHCSRKQLCSGTTFHKFSAEGVNKYQNLQHPSLNQNTNVSDTYEYCSTLTEDDAKYCCKQHVHYQIAQKIQKIRNFTFLYESNTILKMLYSILVGVIRISQNEVMVCQNFYYKQSCILFQVLFGLTLQEKGLQKVVYYK